MEAVNWMALLYKSQNNDKDNNNKNIKNSDKSATCTSVCYNKHASDTQPYLLTYVRDTKLFTESLVKMFSLYYLMDGYIIYVFSSNV